MQRLLMTLQQRQDHLLYRRGGEEGQQCWEGIQLQINEVYMVDLGMWIEIQTLSPPLPPQVRLIQSCLCYVGGIGIAGLRIQGRCMM